MGLGITQLFYAEKHFHDKIEKIAVFNAHRRRIGGLEKLLCDPIGGSCYLLTTWVLIGLDQNDVRVCGEVDVVNKSGDVVQKNYRHAWVEFKYGYEWYVYDSLLDFITPKDIYYELHQPRKITSTKKRDDLIEPFLNEKYTYRIDNDIWQFKSEKEARDNDSQLDGFVFNALQKGRIHGYFSDIPFLIDAFIAYDPRY